jgi:hypothetical protein
MGHPARHTQAIRYKERNRRNAKRMMLVQVKKVPFGLLNPFVGSVAPEVTTASLRS